MPSNRRLAKAQESDRPDVPTKSKAGQDRDMAVRYPPLHLTQASPKPNGWILTLQRTLGNQAVQRILAKGELHSSQSYPDNVIQRRWEEYTVKFGESLADNNKIKIFDDRLDHILERHGPDVEEDSPDFYTFTTRKKAVIKKFVQTALTSGKVYKGVGGAFDFEYEFDHPIGKNNVGHETSRIRVIVVELGGTGKRGKVQTAYPI